MKIPCILRKSIDDKSRIGIDRNDFRNRLMINFEGSMLLMEKAKSAEQPLTGIVVDCNASGGSEILSTMKEFNEIIQSLGISIAPVFNVFILFRPDNKDDIDTKFEECDYTVHRYLDLTENDKEKLYDLKDCNLYQKQGKAIAYKLVLQLLEQGRLMVELDRETVSLFGSQGETDLPQLHQPPHSIPNNEIPGSESHKTESNADASR